MWEVLMWPLQLAAAAVSAIFTKIVGVQAVVSNEVIKLKWGTLVVAGSCSGLGFFLTAVTLGCAYALLFARSRTGQWRIVGMAAMMAVLANWVRVIGLVLIADATRMRSPLMKNHEMFGWVIFLGAMLIWFFLADRIERSESRRTSLPLPAIALAGDGLGPNFVVSAAWWILPLATLLAVAGPLFLYGVRLIPNTTKPPERILGIAAGPAFGTPSGDLTAISTGAWRPAFEAAPFSRTVVWASGTDSVRVDQLAYFEEHQGAELIGDANRVAPDSVLLQERLIGPLDANMRTVRQAVVRDGKRARVVWYWYRVAGIETSSSGRAKLLSLLAFLQREEGGEATFVSVPCRGGDCSAATSLLYRFVTGKQLPSSTSSAGD
jgi:exosortase/archaeosortase family protein